MAKRGQKPKSPLTESLPTARKPHHSFKKGHPWHPPKAKPPEEEGVVAAKGQSAKFRNDLFAIYKEVGGKKELIRLIRGSKEDGVAPDKSLLKDLLKLLLTLYSKELDTETRKEMAKGAGLNNGKNFIFFMDGLGRKEASDVQTLPQQLLTMMTSPDAQGPEGNA